MFIAFECFYSKSYGVLDKNYPKAGLRGVFSNKLRFIFLQPVGQSYSGPCLGPTV